ncbi:MAG: hypothetical protein ABI587_14795 [Gemmatimonadales bacterium]
MIDCEMLVDKMPLVAPGAAAWTPEETSHLIACAECAASWRLVQAAPRLGASAAARIDPARIAERLREQLAEDGRARWWRRAGWLTGLAAAAALSLVVWEGRQREPSATPTIVSASSAEFTVPLAELEGLDTGQLESVLEALEAPLGEAGGGPIPSFGDLDDSQLERVLRSLEG